MSADGSYREFAKRGMQPADGFWPGVVTPLLANAASGFEPALRGSLLNGVDGVIGVYSYGRFTYNVVFAQVPQSQPFVPRLVCERRGRITSDTHYGFAVRKSRRCGSGRS